MLAFRSTTKQERAPPSDDLRRAHRRAAVAYPSFTVDLAAFAAFIDTPAAAGAGAGADAGAGAGAGAGGVPAHVEDVYLACACAAGDAAALRALERDVLPSVARALASSGAVVDDVLAALRERMLVRRADGTPPRIASYAGRGPLRAWLTAAAARLAIDQRRQTHRELDDEDGALADRALAGGAGDAELDAIKRRYGAEFRAALKQAIASLAPDDRTDLRLYYLDGLTLEELAALRRVVPSTVSRRIARIRAELFAATKQAFGARLGVDDAQVESILRLIESRLELSRRAFDVEHR